jgi:WD40 repeat protein
MVFVAVLVAAVAAALGSVAANAATGSEVTWWPPWLPSMDDHYLWWLAGSIAVVAGSALFVWWTQRWYERGLAELIPALQRPEPWMVGRPEEVGDVVAAVLRGGSVGITTAVHGAGGFGKTTVARQVRAERRILRHFDGRVFWVTLGRDVRRGALVEKVNDLVRRIDAGRAQPFTDVQQAAEHLAAVLAEGPRRLIVLDDVWFEEQLAAFPVAGRCARLVTTRIPTLVSGQVISVRVDQMSEEQARRVLTADLTGLSTVVVEALLAETGRWPLLLRLTNRNLVAQARSQADLAAVSQALLQRLRRDGPLRAAGQLPGVDEQQIDIDDPVQRSQAVAATIEASAGLLSGRERDRLAELAIFVEDEIVPVTLVAALWEGTDDVTEHESRTLCARLADLALLTLTPTRTGGVVSLHDVVRDHLLGHLGERVATVHRTLVDTVAAGLSGEPGGDVAWWRLPVSDRYLRDHLVEHLVAAGRTGDAEATAADLRWVQSRLEEAGPAAPVGDLARVPTPRAARLGRLLGQSAHLLAPTNPPHSLADVLFSRLDHDPDWGPQADDLARGRTLPHLANRSRPPDLADPALLRVIAEGGPIYAVAIAPDGTWLASVGKDTTVRLWDTATGTQRATLTGHDGIPYAVAVAADGTWLATGGTDATVRLWDAASGVLRATLTGHIGSVHAVAIAPDGTWLATGGNDGAVRLWDVRTGRPRAALPGHSATVLAVAIAPDGTWLASASDDGTVRLWGADGTPVNVLFGHLGSVQTVAIAPDGTWLATGGNDITIRRWNALTGRQLSVNRVGNGSLRSVSISPDGAWYLAAGEGSSVILSDTDSGARIATFGHIGSVRAAAISADGGWIATGALDGTVRLWDVPVGTSTAESSGETDRVHALAIAPDGTWLATAGMDRTVRLFDLTDTTEIGVLSGHRSEIRSVAIAPDGTWLATAGSDRTVRLWNRDTGDQYAELTGHAGPVRSVVISPDGRLIATAGSHEGVRLWDVADRRSRAELTHHGGPVMALAFAPDGTWLVTAGSDETVRLWDPVTGALLDEFAAHYGPVLAVAVAPGGACVATGGDDEMVRLWDVRAQRQIIALSGHTGTVLAVAFSPDGAWLASAGMDRTIRVWDVAGRAPVATMRVDSPVYCCAWSSAGPELVAGAEAGLHHLTFHPGR